MELSDEVYERYSKRLDYYTDDKIVEIRQSISSKNGALSHKKKELEVLSLGFGGISKSSPAYTVTEDKISQLAIKVDSLETDISSLKDKIANPSKIKLTKSQFLNLIKTAPDKMRAGNAVEKDRIARILFLNLRVNNEKALSFIWREPFNSLVKAIEMSPGADERT